MNEIDDFLSRFGQYLAKANESKKRGNNDYNPLKAVQKPCDEVNMHSGFIYSLLDTSGKHYQDDLFLRLFLEVLGLKEWFGSTANAQVEKEFKYIDLYIFNDTKHIIIENKINANDQPNQIATFIETIRNSTENKCVEYENIFVIFLTLHDREPSKSSRTDKSNNLLWEIKGEFLESKEGEKINRVGYKKVLYENEILEWIKSCQSKSGVGNIANLNYALESYKDIVQIITNKKENAMSVVNFFKDSKDFEIAFEIIKNADSFKDTETAFKVVKNADKIIQEFVKQEMCEVLSNDKFKNWDIEVKGNYLEVFNTLYEKQFFKYKFYLGRFSSGKIFIVMLHQKVKEKRNLPREISKHRYVDTKSEGRWFKDWLSYTADYCRVKNCKDYFLKNYEKVNEINEWLKEQEFNNPDSEIAKLAKEVKDNNFRISK